MTMHEPEEIKKARGLFSRFERTADHRVRIQLFEEALDLLTEFEDLDTKEGALARNIIKSNTRRLLEKMPEITDVEMDSWVRYMNLMATRLEKIRQALLTENPSLQQNYNDFKKIWKAEFLELVKSMA